ncbi:MAG: hypothetical protein HUK21_07595 [Fibrobacteraceae bacterium]|nr:hypothetical protein [Fibrobacteraceae bacterium]
MGKRFLSIMCFLMVPLFGAEVLVSNYVFSVSPSAKDGALWTFSRGDVNSGVSLLELGVGNGGRIQVKNSTQNIYSEEYSSLQDHFFVDVLGERRRVPTTLAGGLGWLLPMFSEGKNGGYLTPAGFVSVRNEKNLVETPIDLPEAAEDMDSAMLYAISGFAYDSSAKQLWIARGSLGLLGLNIAKSANDPKVSQYVFNRETKTLDTLKNNGSINSKKNPSVYAVAVHPETKDLWMGCEKGLWVRSASGKWSGASKILDSARVTGIWMGGEPLQIIVETSSQGKESVSSGLYRLMEGGKDFAKVDFLDTAKKAQKKDIFDSRDYTVSGVAFIGKQAFVGVRAVGGSESGYLKLDSLGAGAWESEDGSEWLFGFKTGATDRDAIVTSIASFPLDRNTMGLAIATYGNGVSVSADTGATWTPILNFANVGKNLGSVRMVPSVITAGGESLVSYKVGKASKITIDVFSYDMRKVRTIVKDAPRDADAARSSLAKEDFWDGYDDKGHPCVMGIYYVRVKDNHGHIGWGKVMTLGGHK